MIVTGFLFIIFGFLYGLTSPLRAVGDVSISSTVTGTISTASGYISSLNDFIPVVELLYVLTVMFLVYEVAYFGTKLINWVIRKIPGIS